MTKILVVNDLGSLKLFQRPEHCLPKFWSLFLQSPALIQSGIGKIVAQRRPDFDHPRWGPHFRTSFLMIEEHGNIHTTFTEES